MSLTSREIERQLRLGEDSRWEYKQVEFASSVLKAPRQDLNASRHTPHGVRQPNMIPASVRPVPETVDRLVLCDTYEYMIAV